MRLVTRARAAGVLLMIGCVLAAYWLTHADAFALGYIDTGQPLRYTPAGAISVAAGVAEDAHPNVFWLSAATMRAALVANPAIADARVHVLLPNRLAIELTERQPAFALQEGQATYLVNADGLILAQTSAADAQALGVPLVLDRRIDYAPELKVGDQLAQPDLTVMLDLGALTPATLGSTAASVVLSVEDDDGFVLSAEPSGWQAIFGQYTPTLRPTDIIPRQVQCLRSLLAAPEAEAATIYLAPLDDRCGTYLPAGASPPSARATPPPGRTH